MEVKDGKRVGIVSEVLVRAGYNELEAAGLPYATERELKFAGMGEGGGLDGAGGGLGHCGKTPPSLKVGSAMGTEPQRPLFER
jgi:hypothetical protein